MHALNSTTCANQSGHTVDLVDCPSMHGHDSTL
jgi:hypothetical protein